MPKLTPAEFLAQQKGATTTTSQPREGFNADLYRQRKQEIQATQTTQAVDQDAAGNLGTGFKPTFESRAEDPFYVDVAKGIGNAPRSLFELGKNVVSAVASPIDTATGVAELVRGGGGKILNKISDITGIEPVGGRVQTDSFDAALDFYAERYGSPSQIRESLVEDPAGVLADGATVAAPVAGATARVPVVSNIARTAAKAEPFSVARQATRPFTDNVATRAIGEAIPKPTDIQRGEVAKALELTPGDLNKITRNTGNDVTQFVSDNKLFRETPEDMVIAMDDLKISSMSEVRNEIAKVQTRYGADDIPQVRDGLQTILVGVDNVPGLENVSTEIRAILQKPDVSLSDIQRAKELIDENSNIYNQFGDARSSAQAQGLANIRSDIRSFIENEVTKATDGQVDIRGLNNKVQTAKQLSDAVVAREQRNLTRQGVTVFDGILGLGAYSQFGLEGAAIAIVGKKIMQTPSFRLALARTIQAQPLKDRVKIAEEIKNNKISPETQELIDSVIIQARNNMTSIEAGANLLDNIEDINSLETENQELPQ